jgi:hypothetical protein
VPSWASVIEDVTKQELKPGMMRLRERERERERAKLVGIVMMKAAGLTIYK